MTSEELLGGHRWAERRPEWVETWRQFVWGSCPCCPREETC